MTIPRILVIAGSDSGGGAGIQADIRTIAMLGGHPMTAITAVTAQNTLGVRAVHPVPTEMVLAQIDAVVEDIGVDAVKIGMIGSAETARAVAERLVLGDLAAVPLVFDPVMIATSGDVLTDSATRDEFARLLARATVSTPNTDELRALSGMRADDEIAIGYAASYLMDQGAGPILVTGVKLPGGAIRENGPGGEVRRSTDPLLFDLLYTRAGWQECLWEAERIDTVHDHGTGCTLASGIATGLAAGVPLPDAIARARAFVRAALLAAPGLGAGHGPMGHALGVAPFDMLQPKALP